LTFEGSDVSRERVFRHLPQGCENAALSFAGIRLSSFCARLATRRYQLIGELIQSYVASAFDFRASAANRAEFGLRGRLFRKSPQPEVSAKSFAHEISRRAAFFPNGLFYLLCHPRRKVKNLDDVFGSAYNIHSLPLERLARLINRKSKAPLFAYRKDGPSGGPRLEMSGPPEGGRYERLAERLA
jgi:hypothetical protein